MERRFLLARKKKSRNSHGKDPRTFEERGHEEERWRIQEGKKQGKWKKKGGKNEKYTDEMVGKD